jgi:hypothetical protein
MSIEFFGTAERDGSTGSIYFSASVDGRSVRNSILEEVFCEQFGMSDGEDSLLVFERERKTVEARAREKIRAGHTNESGGADLVPDDFR